MECALITSIKADRNKLMFTLVLSLGCVAPPVEAITVNHDLSITLYEIFINVSIYRRL